MVRAEDAAGNEDTNSLEFAATPTETIAPTFGGLTGAIDAATGGAVTLSWAAATDDSPPITYNIYWATTSTGQIFTTRYESYVSLYQELLEREKSKNYRGQIL